jgi:hypothetical protein
MDKLFSRYAGLEVGFSRTLMISNLSVDLNSLLDKINLKAAIQYRDELIAARLKSLGVTYLIDVGCDFGSLLSASQQQDIPSHGYDIDEFAVQLCSKFGASAEVLSFQDLVAEPDLNLIPRIKPRLQDNEIVAISILNIIHGEWNDISLRDNLILACISKADYIVITADKRLLNQIMKRFSLEIVCFLGSKQKPISRWYSIYSQFGHPLFAKSSNFELRFWQKITKKDFYLQDRIENFVRLTVILKQSEWAQTGSNRRPTD